MVSNVPFLLCGCSDMDSLNDMELASAFLYFSTVEPEKIMGFFPKQGSENITCIARGFYPLHGYYLEEEGKFCIYDRLCGTDGEIEVEDASGMEIDFENLQKLNVDKRTKEVRGAVSDIKRKSSSSMMVGKLLMGYENLQSILNGRNADSLASSTVSLENYVMNERPDKFQVKAALDRLRLNIDSEIDIYKKLCNFDGNNFKNYINEKNNIYDNYNINVTKMERSTGKNIGDLQAEKEEKIREAKRLYSSREDYIAGDYLLNKNKYDIAGITECKVEMDLCQAAMSDSESKIDKVRKELQEEVKNIYERYDNLTGDQKNMLRAVIKDRDDNMSKCENSYNELHGAVDELKKAISVDIYGKKEHIEEIRGYLAGLNLGDEVESITINIPFYIAELKGKSVRYQLFFPASMREKSQMKSIITEMAGKISLPFEVRNSLFEGLHERLAKWLEDPAHKGVYTLFKQKNLAEFEGMHEKIENGLSEMFTRGFMSDKNLDRSLISIRPIFSNK